jgi:hypothetical protein
MIPNSTPDSSEPTPPPADDSPAAVPGDEREEREEMEISDDPDPELAPESAESEEIEIPVVRVTPRPSPPRPWGGSRGAVSAEDLTPEELTPEMRWPPGSWVKVNDVVRHSTGEPIEGLAVGDVGQVIAALSQTLVVIFPTRDNRREVIHIDSIEAVEVPARSKP